MAKYIKDFDTTAEMQAYYQTASKGYYLLKDKSGSEGIGTTLTSGKQIVSLYKSQHDYLTFTAVDAGATVKYNAATNTTAEYSTDGGNTWANAVGVTVTLQNIGDSVKYRGTITGNISTTSARFSFNSSKKVAASGSIMSMYNNNSDDTVITYEGAFRYMFSGCYSLTTVPELPATTLSLDCYGYMFKNCTSLTTAPELPAIELANYCYEYMFQSCTSLTSAPELPATVLASNCYYNMFYGCSSLTLAPELPATTLAVDCYRYMFTECTSLTTAPELPATTLVQGCYSYMFRGCTSLTSVTHHITDWSTNYTGSWLSDVAASGTITCPAASTIPSDNTSGIPTGWTRVDL